ncbi:cytidine deaminase-like protein [Phakopsora pachyrhizi]|uniref:Cytidine deaminase-like protein n=1 Tax=Phakopsora pachyrhizi TaxID=170000 RepID=A0AAV0BHR7_PHAPC|nr:cytidine deaminase-like protein [Phakopsora pachyrhizi]
MREAIEMAEDALKNNEIPVGCVFVDKELNLIVSSGRNKTNETKNACLHAEFDALENLLPSLNLNSNLTRISSSSSSIKKLTLYVTVEPCLMCSSALRQIGLRDVIFGCSNDKFGGCGGVISINDDPRLKFSKTFEARGGYMREESIILLRKFYITENMSAPVPKKKTNRVLKTEVLPIV